MKLVEYIKYFYFLLDNWDLKVAWYIIKQEIRGEKKYGINTIGADELLDLEELGVDISHAAIYMPASYSLMEEIFDQFPTSPRHHFHDIGSGKGRALCIAAHYGFAKVTGLELSKKLCDIAKENLSKTNQKFPALQFNIVNNDAFYYSIPGDVDCIFMFNPFDEIIMSAVVNNISESLQQHPRHIRIIYINPVHKELFTEAGYQQTWYCKKMKYVSACILEN